MSQPATDIIARDIHFDAADGYRLSGRLFSGPTPHMAVLVSSGTGYPMGFYERIARFMAERGAIVLTYDFRGIAASAPETLKGSDIDYPQWGQLDMPAALDALKAAAPDLKVFHIGHSIGGSFAGFMHNHADIQKHAFVSVGSGYWPHHLRQYNATELFFWLGLGPIMLMTKGYIAQGKMWTGASLPRKVFTTWRRWCFKPDFYNGELKSGKLEPQYFSQLKSPIRSWLFTDDPIATPRAAQTVLAAYSTAPSETVLKQPSDYNRPRIGHEGAFRKGMEPLWQEIHDWFAQDLSAGH